MMSTHKCINYTSSWIIINVKLHAKWKTSTYVNWARKQYAQLELHKACDSALDWRGRKFCGQNNSKWPLLAQNLKDTFGHLAQGRKLGFHRIWWGCPTDLEEAILNIPNWERLTLATPSCVAMIYQSNFLCNKRAFYLKNLKVKIQFTRVKSGL